MNRQQMFTNVEPLKIANIQNVHMQEQNINEK